ncbi:bifunctional phosphoribosyl-AMP cyclohydrolase/phosphoribosyl-ATP diphosphatase HisIE [Helicobacter saguini]|uniref:Histidine biosynthesis bifunctional protein HisIE n=1 Tax=Helicobacter saguini TaxID=1548018 RepID=A0A347VM11_9HELI|nr:bifunctional phosphoribosyl-AMP cyclohydrolase/phosphoribosyl-ATP diphosphatase HisIE [Helicobacter saguini]MWV67541.1 bifunctional phosphoribosyl-AMP cyclohydrolase/phosphoribosyl-ATP diphosphatase HisIE [Helicobacter saguini]MWV69892.1 bifunctional phosphoribosyl-AMP cyclohydrolase/phosphoribosyl-ATP diphosphatase HisIE [Helicobacter saguini]MWV72891.1 bifunctional phosphoribosyl-AMP cyclohydrolase/phosphoribosyl-ATP diphosphatase HisIE [Helicobacter saguini]TLD93244.1 bifunctional phospho
MLDILQHLKYDKFGLIPCVTQDFKTKEVLMLAFMNKESIEMTLKTHIAHYFSRSKQRLWQKGEMSGNVQKVREMRLDCDLDSILLLVEQKGVACHTGNKSCFFKSINFENLAESSKLDSKKKNKIGDNVGNLSVNLSSENARETFKDSKNISNLSDKQSIQKSIEMYGILDTLYHILQERKGANPDTSYTASLFAKGENAIAKKIIEEAGEFCFAFKDNDEGEIIYEGADVLYHLFVALAKSDIHPDRIYAELEKRVGVSGLEEKANRSNKTPKKVTESRTLNNEKKSKKVIKLPTLIKKNTKVDSKKSANFSFKDSNISNKSDIKVIALDSKKVIESRTFKDKKDFREIIESKNSQRKKDSKKVRKFITFQNNLDSKITNFKSQKIIKFIESKNLKDSNISNKTNIKVIESNITNNPKDSKKLTKFITKAHFKRA